MLTVPLYDYEDEIDKRSRPRSGWFRQWLREVFKIIVWVALLSIGLAVILAFSGGEP